MVGHPADFRQPTSASRLPPADFRLSRAYLVPDRFAPRKWSRHPRSRPARHIARQVRNATADCDDCSDGARNPRRQPRLRPLPARISGTALSAGERAAAAASCPGLTPSALLAAACSDPDEKGLSVAVRPLHQAGWPMRVDRARIDRVEADPAVLGKVTMRALQRKPACAKGCATKTLMPRRGTRY
jgi:hypothetical protein